MNRVAPEQQEAAELGSSPTLAPTQDAAPEGAEEEAEAQRLVGTMAGSFRLARVIGRGGMGTVYLGEHPVIGSKVAIKFLRESLASSADVVSRFYDEARAVNLIGHDNIVSIYDLSQLPPNRFYFVMEHLEGSKLTSLIKGEPLAPAVALSILVQLCDALQAAHQRGVVHRDLKPDNVFLVRRRGREHFVKLLDFGISKLRDAHVGRSQTAVGMLLGTPEYMAPEQCDSRPVDGRTDVYALGVIAYQLLAGRLPFCSSGLTALLLAHLNEPPVPPSQHNPALHPAWNEVVLRALAKRPEARFESMEAFGAALEAAHRASPPPAAAPAPRVPAEPVAPTPKPLQSRHLAGFEVEVRSAVGNLPPRLLALNLSRGGAYLCVSGSPPPVYTRLTVAFTPPQAERRLEVQAEVVRHMSAEEARAWGAAPGMGVRFVDLDPPQRSALDALITRLPHAAPPARARGTSDDRVATAPLEYFAKRVGGSHYALLGLPADSDFAEIRRRTQRLQREVQALRVRHLSPQQLQQVEAILERLSAALATLGAPDERLEYDAWSGNYLGVTHCLMAGASSARAVELRRRFLAARPDAEARAQAHAARGAQALDDDDELGALAEYEAALTLDPLDLSLHQRFWALKRDFNSRAVAT